MPLAGADVGHLWVWVDAPLQRAFIYAFLVVEDRRRRGIGRQALRLLEDHLRAQDVTRISLNVFADNAGARTLYEGLGYRTTSYVMLKAL